MYTPPHLPHLRDQCTKHSRTPPTVSTNATTVTPVGNSATFMPTMVTAAKTTVGKQMPDIQSPPPTIPIIDVMAPAATPKHTPPSPQPLRIHLPSC
ncbi:hypothetical protein AAHC03_019451 [Spirometra sp. Aus1]